MGRLAGWYRHHPYSAEPNPFDRFGPGSSRIIRTDRQASQPGCEADVGQLLGATHRRKYWVKRNRLPIFL